MAPLTLITGANKGIGFELARCFCELYSQKGKGTVLVGSRNSERGREAVKKLRAEFPACSVHMIEIDVKSKDSVRTASDNVRENYGYLDVLVNNAGVYTKESPEEIITVNYYGVRNCFEFLFRLMKPKGRVISVSSLLAEETWPKMSQSNRMALMEEHLTTEKLDEIVARYVEAVKTNTVTQIGYPEDYPYGVSKVFVNAITRIAARSHKAVSKDLAALVMCGHPGWCRTDMAGYEKPPQSAREGAENLFILATAPEAEDMQGSYFNQGVLVTYNLDGSVVRERDLRASGFSPVADAAKAVMTSATRLLESVASSAVAALSGAAVLSGSTTAPAVAGGASAGGADGNYGNVRAKYVAMKEYVNEGVPDPKTHFESIEKVLDVRTLNAWDVFAQLVIVSVDPYLRGRMKSGIKSYVDSFVLHEPIQNFGVARILKSAHPQYQRGDWVAGFLPWQDYFVINLNQRADVKKVEVNDDILPTYYASVLGMPGSTAYFGLNKVLEPKSGETIYISAAAGAVGQLVGQLAKLKGCRVVGSAGSDDKCNFLKSIGFDEAFNYKKCSDAARQKVASSTDESGASYSDALIAEYVSELKRTCPQGIDMYFENVGGEMLDAVLIAANQRCRIACCGMISQYNKGKQETYGIKNTAMFLMKGIKMRGFIVASLQKEHGMEEFYREVSALLKSKQIKYQEDISQGSIEKAPAVFVKMLQGQNFGKQLLQIAH